MSSDVSMSRYRYAVAVDCLTEDIMRIRSGAVSEYAVPRRLLTEARGCMFSDRRRCLKLLRKARVAYAKEADLAVRYARVSERMRFSGDNRLESLNQRYTELVAAGKYSAAAKILKDIERRTADAVHQISVNTRSLDGDSATLEVKNTSPTELQVILVKGRCGGSALSMTPASFALPPFASCTVICRDVSDGQVVELNVAYRVGTSDRTLAIPVALR